MIRQPSASESLYIRHARHLGARIVLPVLLVGLFGISVSGAELISLPSRIEMAPAQPIQPAVALPTLPDGPSAPVAFPFHRGDTVGWCGSSSTAIGVWPRTMEFLLRTRHPELKLKFQRYGIGGATFASALKRIDGWLPTAHPNVLFYNFGANDAGGGTRGLASFEQNMEAAVHDAAGRGIRVLLLTPQSADPRKSGLLAMTNRHLYAETMLAYGQLKKWAVIDIHHPIDALQHSEQAEDPTYSINRDRIHLTNAGYVAWGYYLYQNITPPRVVSNATVSAEGRTVAMERCKVSDLRIASGVLSFDRSDEVLPILPPLPLPPSQYVPLEALSRYEMRVTDLPALPPGMGYEITCQGESIGVVSRDELEKGVNLNSVLIASGNPAPWREVAEKIWSGQGANLVGSTTWHFEVRPAIATNPGLPDLLPGAHALSHLLTEFTGEPHARRG